eukprot:Skav208880  [mRNA]  locus=scaffold270:175272:175793:- [translate_table: standard]
MNESDANSLVGLLVPIFYSWLRVYFTQTEYEAFETCTEACSKMAMLVDVGGHRMGYPILAAAFASARLAENDLHPQHVPCMPIVESIYPARQQLPLHLAVAPLDEQAVNAWLEAMGLLAAMLRQLANFATDARDLQEAWWLFDCHCLVVSDILLIKAGRARNRNPEVTMALSP